MCSRLLATPLVASLFNAQAAYTRQGGLGQLADTALGLQPPSPPCMQELLSLAAILVAPAPLPLPPQQAPALLAALAAPAPAPAVQPLNTSIALALPAPALYSLVGGC